MGTDSLRQHSAAALIAMAISMQDEQRRGYRMWSLRFKPFHAGVSQLLAALAEEGLRRIDHLNKTRQDALGDCYLPHSIGQRRDGLLAGAASHQHFFVVDQAMAAELLSAALQTENRAAICYRACAAAVPQTVLRVALHSLADDAEFYCPILEETRDGFVHVEPAMNSRPRLALVGGRLVTPGRICSSADSAAGDSPPPAAAPDRVH